MKIKRIGNFNIGIVSTLDLIAKNYSNEQPELSKLSYIGSRRLSKAVEQKSVLPAPVSMAKLLQLTEIDEYHEACISALINSTLMRVEVKNSGLKAWFKSAEFPGNEDPASVLAEFLRYYLTCGNGFLLKMRNAKGEWVGLERMLPTEVQIVENYDEFGFFKPDFIQVKNNKKKFFPGSDIIHFKKATHKSNAWGLACIPVAINIEILNEIKTFDYNNFKNGLLVDYFMIVEGGTLRDEIIEDENGNEVMTDAFTEIQKVLNQAKGNSKSHTTILIETESKDARIRLEPLRQQDREGAFISLKKDLREGIFAYHRVPARIVSQLIPGQLGGDNKSDMQMFYNFVVKPLQNRLGMMFSKEFIKEYNWSLSAEDFDFGVLTDIFETEDEKIFKSCR